jgi:phosphate-selective porin OprO and OprP
MKQKLLVIAISTLTATAAYAGNVTTSGEDLVISTDGGFKVHTKDKSKSFQIGGRLQWDYDDTESDTKETTDFDVRRARIFVKGNINDWSYKAQFNIAESDGAEGGDAEDLYVRYTGWGKQAQLTIGKQKEPFGLEELTSSKDISVLERSAITEFYAPGRSGGIQLSGKGSNWTYGIGVFEADGDSDNDFDNTAITGRVTFTPLKDGDTVVHLGAAFSSRDADTSANEVDQFGLELAATMGPLHAQAEYIDAEFGNVDADGYYLQIGYILTGETRPYKDGVFKRVKPANQSGAWEVVLRFDDGDGKYSDIGVGSGDGSQTTVGVNWYANNHVKLGLSYMDGKNDDSNEDGEELRLRMQFVF